MFSGLTICAWSSNAWTLTHSNTWTLTHSLNITQKAFKLLLSSNTGAHICDSNIDAMQSFVRMKWFNVWSDRSLHTWARTHSINVLQKQMLGEWIAFSWNVAFPSILYRRRRKWIPDTEKFCIYMKSLRVYQYTSN